MLIDKNSYVIYDSNMGQFFSVLFTVFIAEMGDKTQLMLIAMTSKYKLKDIVLGTLFAILCLNALAVFAGAAIGAIIPQYLIKFIATVAFFFFAITSLKASSEEENIVNKNISLAIVAVFCTFFVAELGDKTQLAAITFGATMGLRFAMMVWIACSAGLFLADVLGMLAGILLKTQINDRLLKRLAFVVFSCFALESLYQALKLLSCEILPIMLSCATIYICVIFVLFFYEILKTK